MPSLPPDGPSRRHCASRTQHLHLCSDACHFANMSTLMAKVKWRGCRIRKLPSLVIELQLQASKVEMPR